MSNADFLRALPPWRACRDWWPSSTPITWGPVVADGRRLWSHRVLALVAARVGVGTGDVAERLLDLRSQHRYLILGTIARTRRCTVVAAIDQLLAREVAIKVLNDIDDFSTWAMMAEVQAMARLDHPHVVRLHELGDHEGWLYATMELCDGDLEICHRGPPWQSVLDRIIEAGRGLAAVHAAGLAHGDSKPENILIRDGLAKLGDFGLTATPGRPERIAGTPGYIAPEVADGERGTAGDVFALAVTAWWCLTGRHPFGPFPPTADTSAATVVLIERAREGMIDTRNAAVPSPILTVLRRALDPDPRVRPGLDELLARLVALRDAGRVGRWIWWWRLRSSKVARSRG